MALHHHLLVAQLLGHIFGRGAAHLNPGLGEDGAGGEDEDQVEDEVEGVGVDLGEGGGRGDVVRQAGDGDGRARVVALVLPHAQETHEDVAAVAVVQQLGEEVEVAHEGGLEDDGHVGGVEQLDGVLALLPTMIRVLNWNIHAPALEEDHDEEDEDRGEKVGDVGQIGAVEGFLEGFEFVLSSDHEMEEGNQGALELRPASRVNGRGREGFPDNALADIGRDEEGDSRAKSISFLQELVQDDDHHARHEQLRDDQNRIPRAQSIQISVHAREDIGNGLSNGDQNAEELLCGGKESAVLLQALVDFNDSRPGQ